jgi:DNA-binding NarL/FixJ family response regulator
MDTQMPGLKGVDAVRHMINDSPGIKLLALSMHASRQFADEMIKAGACGYLLKNYAFEELVPAIQTVVQGRIYLCPGIEDSAAPDSG